MNFIGIDLSLNSTAVFIQTINSSYNKSTILSFTNKKDNNIYIKELGRSGVKFFFAKEQKKDIYSKNEMMKIQRYDDLSEKIISEIIKNIDTSKTFCQMEGYSYSSGNTTSLLDIVSLSTLVRFKLLKRIRNLDMTVISPSSLKKDVCGYVYGYYKKGKTKNDLGISGGRFKKPEMFKAMLDGKIQSPIFNFLIEYKHLMERKKIPNPIEDIIDATFACKLKQKEVENL